MVGCSIRDAKRTRFADLCKPKLSVFRAPLLQPPHSAMSPQLSQLCPVPSAIAAGKFEMKFLCI